MRTLANVVRWRAERRPDFAATWYQGRERTYAQLNRSSTELAAGMVAKLDLQPGDRVGILDKNSDDYVELLLALDKAGAVACPINARLTAPEVAAVVEDASPAVVVVGDEMRVNANSLSGRVLGFDELPRIRDGQDPHRDMEEAVTWQIYTSGTTGVAKGARITNLNLFGSIGNLFLEIDGFEEYGRTLVAMPLYHVGGCGWVRYALFAGCTAVIARDFVPDEILDVLVERKVSTAFLVPAALRLLVSQSRARSAGLSLKNIVYGASPITPELVTQSLEAFGCRLTQVYGMTETTGSVAFLRHEDHVGPRLLSCGRPGYGHELRIFGDHGGELPRGELGEIVYRGPSTMVGYWRKEAETSEAIRDGWFHSGDAGRMDQDGFIYIQDRIKDMIISGGENIYPADVERVIATNPAVADVAVIGVPDEQWGEAVKAIVTLREGSTLGADELIQWSRAKLAGFKRPKSVDFVDAIPRSPSGKLLRKGLRESYWANAERRVH
jgi:long-chain acyl-CoA synthetase